MKTQLSRDEKQKKFLSEQYDRLEYLTRMWKAHHRDLFHPITNADGSYWRNGRWNDKVEM